MKIYGVDTDVMRRLRNLLVSIRFKNSSCFLICVSGENIN